MTGSQVRAITIRQPWAWAIIFAGKDVENRSWYTHYRGPLLIHAGATYRPHAPLPRGIVAPDRGDLDFSAVIGVVDLVDVVDRSRSRWFNPDGYGFVLRNPRALKRPVPCKGRLGLWTPTAGQLRLVGAQVAGVLGCR